MNTNTKSNKFLVVGPMKTENKNKIHLFFAQTKQAHIISQNNFINPLSHMLHKIIFSWKEESGMILISNLSSFFFQLSHYNLYSKTYKQHYLEIGRPIVNASLVVKEKSIKLYTIGKRYFAKKNACTIYLYTWIALLFFVK